MTKYTAKLDDLLLHRLTVYGRLLAGRGLPFPLETITAYCRLDPALIRDDRARAFLAALVERRADLEAVEDPSGLAVQLAADSGALYDLTSWAVDAAKTGRYPPELVIEIARMASALNVMSDVKSEAAGERLDQLDLEILAAMSAAGVDDGR